jgi:hypothetical protein
MRVSCASLAAVLLHASLASANYWFNPLNFIRLGNATAARDAAKLLNAAESDADAANSPLPPTSWPGMSSSTTVTTTTSNGWKLPITLPDPFHTTAAVDATDAPAAAAASHGHKVSIIIPDPVPSVTRRAESVDVAEDEAEEEASADCNCPTGVASS